MVFIKFLIISKICCSGGDTIGFGGSALEHRLRNGKPALPKPLQGPSHVGFAPLPLVACGAPVRILAIHAWSMQCLQQYLSHRERLLQCCLYSSACKSSLFSTAYAFCLDRKIVLNWPIFDMRDIYLQEIAVLHNATSAHTTCISALNMIESFLVDVLSHFQEYRGWGLQFYSIHHTDRQSFRKASEEFLQLMNVFNLPDYIEGLF